MRSPLCFLHPPWYNVNQYGAKKESSEMTEKKKTMARIIALVVAGIMTFSVILAVILK